MTAHHATELEELERLRTRAERTRHDALPPMMYVQIAEELRRAAARGSTTAGRMFARRRARVDQFVVPEVPVQRRPPPVAATPPPLPPPKPDVVAADVRRSVSQPDVNRESAPQSIFVPRLKQMLDMPRPAMTPWEAAAQYGGRVDPAFEHLSAYREAAKVEWTTVTDDDYCQEGATEGVNSGTAGNRIVADNPATYYQTDAELEFISRQQQVLCRCTVSI